ncbi:hypothetical protein AB9P05_05080 [Roseivirga sp. BDSF3-8]
MSKGTLFSQIISLPPTATFKRIGQKYQVNKLGKWLSTHTT